MSFNLKDNLTFFSLRQTFQFRFFFNFPFHENLLFVLYCLLLHFVKKNVVFIKIVFSGENCFN